MYKWFALKRIAKGLFMYALLICIMSALFNSVVETTLRSQIEEQVRLESARFTTQSTTALQNFQKERREQLLRNYKLDRPFAERFLYRAISTLTFQFGKSTIIKSSRGDREVLTILAEAIPRSLLLFTLATAIQIVIGVLLGLKKAQKPGSALDRSTTLITMIMYGLPTWWFAMLMILLFVYALKLFPSGGMHSIPPPQGILFFLDTLWHTALPLFTLVVIGFWGLAFVVRNIVLGILQEDYIMAARARGLPEKTILLGHTLRTASPPIITMSLLSLLGSISGSIIIEGIFSWPGLGNLYWIAIQQNDIPVLMANLALTIGLYQSGLVILDLIYGFLDPRIKLGGKM